MAENRKDQHNFTYSWRMRVEKAYVPEKRNLCLARLGLFAILSLLGSQNFPGWTNQRRNHHPRQNPGSCGICLVGQ